jgi:hypothetical protein
MRQVGEPASRRHLVAAALAGAVCGGLWVLLVSTVLEIVGPGTISIPIALGVWAAPALAVATALSAPGPVRQSWGRAVLVVGLHALAMPVAAAGSLAASGLWPPAETADLGFSLDLLGVRLVGSPATVRLGVGGFVVGLLLVAIGDRALQRRAAGRIGGDAGRPVR